MRYLTDLGLHEQATITNIKATPAMLEHLADLGLTDGCRVELLGRAPLGDPILIHIRGTVIAIRKEQAQTIEIL